MNVKQTMEIVNTFVLILNLASIAPVIMDTTSQMMLSVQVNIKIQEYELFLNGLVLYVCIHFCVIDIDECSEETDKCHQICINTLGGYYCVCSDGFTLDSNNQTCHGLYYIRLL